MPGIVVVDDDQLIRMLLVAILESAGHQVTEAPGAAEGLDAVRKVAPDLVFVDAMMPDTDGYELSRNIRSDSTISPQPYLILLTATADRVDPDRLTQAGIDELMAKPFDAGQILHRVNVCLSEGRKQN